jgi:hypothetical protein
VDRPFRQNLAATAGEQNWISAATITQIRSLIASRLDGRREVDGDVELISSQLVAAARDKGFTPERMLIALRALWRDFALSQHDRLQLAGLYDHIVRRTIDKYYED